MRLAIVSDIHANWEALERVAADWERQKIDRVVSLGDQIGYGPDPGRVLAFIDQNAIPALQGNHERALVHPQLLEWFNRDARRSLEITRDCLSPAEVERLHRLPLTLSLAGARFVHGCPPASCTVYLFQPEPTRLARIMAALPERLSFVGHTHTLERLEATSAGLRRRSLAAGVHRLDPNTRQIINVGSVGQPRDGDSRAKYVIWDSLAMTLEVRFIDYDIAVTVDKLRRRGFPVANALRLW